MKIREPQAGSTNSGGFWAINYFKTENIMRMSRQREISGKILLSRLEANPQKIAAGGRSDFTLINPLTREPYIPGSSLKDSLKEAIEKTCLKASTGEASRLDPRLRKAFAALFGSAPSENPLYSGPSRLVIRDALPSDSKAAEEFAAGRADSPPLELSLDIALRVYEDTLDMEEEMLNLLLCGLLALEKDEREGFRLSLRDLRLDGGPCEKL